MCPETPIEFYEKEKESSFGVSPGDVGALLSLRLNT
jgi:hypothetical protein